MTDADERAWIEEMARREDEHGGFPGVTGGVMQGAHTRIHAAPCEHCPSAHYPPDPEALEILTYTKRVQLAYAFPCAWRRSALCRGYCDRAGITEADVSAGQVLEARAEVGRG